MESTPVAVPVQDWKRRNWRGETRISLAIAARRSPGKKSSVEFAIWPLNSASTEVEWDVLDYRWHQGRRPGLGEELLTCVDACIQRICRHTRQSFPPDALFFRLMQPPR